MTQETTRKRTSFPDKARILTSSSWHRIALAAVLMLSAFLNLLWLPSEGYGNTYYAATVKSMLASWSNFFFASYDAGFVSVDKPPLRLWIQAASAWLFGFSGPSILLPQAIAGVLSVAVLYHLVRRSFGPMAGLLAALALAVTPISVAVQRNNVMDALLILALLLAAWAFVVAAERGSLQWLLLGAFVVGLGFNIKMLQAFLVLPAFYLLYLLATRTTWRQRFLHLGAATVVLVVVSLSWAVAVDLTPAGERPYVGSSPDDSVLGLVLGYNGFDRLLGVSFGSSGESIPAGAPGGPGGGTMELGDPSPLRLLNGRLAGQASGSCRWRRWAFWRRSGREDAPSNARPPAREPRAVGRLVSHDGRLLQRRLRRSPVLHGDARPSRGGAGGHRRGSVVEGLPEPGSALVATAARAGRDGHRAGVRPPGLPRLARLADTRDRGFESGRGRLSRARAPEGPGSANEPPTRPSRRA